MARTGNSARKTRSRPTRPERTSGKKYLQWQQKSKQAAYSHRIRAGNENRPARRRERTLTGVLACGRAGRISSENQVHVRELSTSHKEKFRFGTARKNRDDLTSWATKTGETKTGTEKSHRPLLAENETRDAEQKQGPEKRDRRTCSDLTQNGDETYEQK
jgi:hypothetical protein